MTKRFRILFFAMFFVYSLTLLSCDFKEIIGNITGNTEKEASILFMVDNELYHRLELEEGDEIEFPANPIKEGYEFVGWYSDYELTVKFDYTTLMESGNIILYAKFKETEGSSSGSDKPSNVYYTVTFYVDGALYSSQTILENSTYTFPADPYKEGYEFKGWKYNGDLIYNPTKVTFDIVLEAVFEKITQKDVYYTVEFIVDGKVYDAQQVLEKTSYKFPANPVKEGYKFIGWYYNGQYWDFETPVTSNMVIEARFEEIKVKDAYYTVTFYVDGSIYEVQTVKENELFIMNEPTKEGYYFAGWLNGEAEYIAPIPVTSNMTLVAKFVAIDKYSYVEYPNYIEITGYNGNETEVVIPSEINGKPVTHIGKNIFPSSLRVKKLVIPNSVIYIASGAFTQGYNNASIEELHIPIVYCTNENEYTYALDSMGFYYSVIKSLYITNENCLEQGFLGAGYNSTCEKIVISNCSTFSADVLLSFGAVKTVVLPSELQYFTAMYFDDTKDVTFYFEGNMEQWNSIKDTNVEINVATYSEEEPTTAGKYWHYVDGEPTMWDVEVYTIKFLVDENDYQTIEVIEGQSISFDNEPIKEGHIFEYWKDDNNNAYYLNTEYTFTSDTTLKANFYRYRYNINYVFEYENVINNNPQTFNVGSIISLEDAYLEGYSFEGWYLDSNYTKECTEVGNNIIDVTVYGKFEKENVELFLISDMSNWTVLEEYKLNLSEENSYTIELYIERGVQFIVSTADYKQTYYEYDLTYGESVESIAPNLRTLASGVYRIEVKNGLYYVYLIKDDSFTYVEYEDYIEITRYTGSDSEVIIPSEINDKPVIRIGTGAFNGSNVSKIVLPDGLLTIGFTAFDGCVNLKEIIIPKSVTFIDIPCFDHGTNITIYFENAEFGMNYNHPMVNKCYYSEEEPTTEGNYWHYDESGNPVVWEVEIIKDLYLYFQSYSEVDKYKFDYSEGVWSLEVELEKGAMFHIQDNDGNIINETSLEYGEGAVFVPGAIQTTKSGLFRIEVKNDRIYIYLLEESNDSGFTYNEYEDYIEITGYKNFDGNLLETLYIPGEIKGKPVTLLATVCLDVAKEVIIGEGIKTIGLSAFDKARVESIQLPNSLEYINGGAFYMCYNLKEISIPKNVKYIGNQSFRGVPFENLVIPSNVETIEIEAFYECVGDIYYEGTLEKWNTFRISSDPTFDLDVYFYTETQPTTEGNYWHYVDGVPTVWEVLEVYTPTEALTIADGTEVIIKGTVKSIRAEWSDTYKNISVFITDGTTEIQAYRLSTYVEVGDVIMVTGKMATYNNQRQIAAGATAEIIDHLPTHSVTYMIDDEIYKVVNVLENNQITLIQPKKDGYRFIGWYYNDLPYDSNLYITEDITLVAVFEELEHKMYKVNYYAFGFNYMTSTITEGYNLEHIENPTYSNLDFVGWYYNGELWDVSTPITYDLELEAKFVRSDSKNEILKYNNFYYYFDSTYGLCIYKIEGSTSAIIPYSIGNEYIMKIDKEVFTENYVFYYEGTRDSWSNIYIEISGYPEDLVYYYSETEPTTEGNYWHYVDGEPTAWVQKEVYTPTEALAIGDGLEITVKGTVKSIKTEWNDTYNNISVYITDGTSELLIFRLNTKVVVGDVIILTGTMATYMEEREIDAGATAEILDHVQTHSVTFMIDDKVYKVVDVLENYYVTLSKPESEQGYRFIGWYYNDEYYKKTPITEDITLVGKYEQSEFSIVFIVDDQVFNEFIVGYPYNQILYPIQPEKEGYEFIGWYYSDNTVALEGSTITSNITLYAKFEEKILFEYTEYEDYIEITGYTGSDSEVIIPSEINGLTVTKIGSEAFSGCTNITSITMPDTIVSVGFMAFLECSNLSTIKLSNKLETIGAFAFKWCSNLSDITLPESLTYIGGCAFIDCFSLTSITIPNQITSIEDSTFMYCTSLTSVVLPDTVNNIAYNAFSECPNLRLYVEHTDEEWNEVNLNGNDFSSISINKKGGEISWTYDEEGDIIEAYRVEFLVDGEIYHTDYVGTGKIMNEPEKPVKEGYNFIGWYNAMFDWIWDFSVTVINPLTLEAQFEEIIPFTYNEYEDYVQITGYTGSDLEVVIPSEINGLKVTSVSIEYNSLITNVVFPENSFSYISFMNCSSLTSIIVPEGITETYYMEFVSCSSLETVVLPESFIIIGEGTFAACSKLSNIVFGNNLETIVSNAFRYCESLQELILPVSLKTIGENAFADCNSLNTIYYCGNNEEWGKVSISSGNDPITNSNVYFYTETEPTIEGNYWHYDENGNPVVWEVEIIKDLYLYFQSYSEVDKYKFDYSEGVWSLEVELEKGAMFHIQDNDGNIINETSLEYGEGAVFVPGAIQTTKSGLFRIEVKNDRIYIYLLEESNDSDFTYNEYEDYIEITKYIGDEEVVEIPSEINGKAVTHIADFALSEYTFKELILPNSIENIGESILSGCDKLESLTIPFIPYDGLYKLFNTIDSVPTSLKKVTITEENYIQRLLFLGTYVEEVHFLSDMEKIDVWSLTEPDCIKSVFIPTNIMTLTVNEKLENINFYYTGNDKEFENVGVYGDITNINIYFYSESQPTTEGNYWHYVDGEATVWA